MISENEIRQLLAVMKVVYPNMPISEATLIPTIKFYQRVYVDYTYDELTMAFEAYSKTNLSGFPPQPAHLINIIESARENFLDFSEVYSLIYKAVGRASVNAKNDFDNFPEIVQRLVGSPSQLREWGATAYPDRKSLEWDYKKIVEETKNKNRLSGKTMLALSQTTGMAIEEKENVNE